MSKAFWNEQKAFDITQAWLTRFGDQIKGVFAANDGMGMGALSLAMPMGESMVANKASAAAVSIRSPLVPKQPLSHRRRAVPQKYDAELVSVEKH